MRFRHRQTGDILPGSEAINEGFTPVTGPAVRRQAKPAPGR